MSIQEWNERYRSGKAAFETPSPLVVRFASELTPGSALDLACGAGRNALYLAERGWRVTAVDGSPAAIEILRERAAKKSLTIDARVADLERGGVEIEPDAYDLVCDCYYLQRDLFPRIRSGVRPGGLAIVIVHLTEPGQPETKPRRLGPGELRGYFADWPILHSYEGQSHEPSHQRPVAELVAARAPA